MALRGIRDLIFGVDDLDTCARFYEDFGLVPGERTEDAAQFELPEGSRFVLRRAGAADLPDRFLDGSGPREIIWGVDSRDSLDRIATDLARDRTVASDPRTDEPSKNSKG